MAVTKVNIDAVVVVDVLMVGISCWCCHGDAFVGGQGH